MDFDKLIDRRNTDCLKFDAAVRRGYPEDILPLWVADMDFPVAQPVIEAIQKRTAHGIFGYSEPDSVRFYHVLEQWFREQHHWQIQQDWLLQTPGVVFALAMAVKAFTNPGDAVLIQQPVYYPFSEVILDNGRRRVSSDLVLRGRLYEIDFTDFEQKIIENQVKLFLLCSPHNPAGRVWTREELAAVAGICHKHNVIVVADEIHEDFVWTERPHIPYASLGEPFAQQAVICTAPSKTFNLAGMLFSNVIIRDGEERARFTARDKNIGAANPLSIAAHKAAYEQGGEWLEQLKTYLDGNFAYVDSFIKENFPEAVFEIPESTYFAWVDLSHVLPDVDDLPLFFANNAGVLLEGGDKLFVGNAKGCIRLNLAMPRSIIKTGLERIKEAVRKVSI